MIRIILLFISLNLFVTGIIFSQHDMGSDQSSVKYPAVLIPGLGSLDHPVTTKNKQAQNFFNQGLTLIYAFNHNEAVRSFKKAAKLDHEMAMAYWGIAYALGPNYNLPADDVQRKQAYNALKKAIKHSKHSSQKEKDYITALSKRYKKDLSISQSVSDVEFRTAMKTLKDKYNDDLDAATLYAESMMVLKPWQLWNKDGTPAEGTEEIISVLESVIARNPNHSGANHYYIHTVEASNDPGKALHSAQVLKDLIPAAGHLVHMPAHTFFRVGDYEGASLANFNAINADESYISRYKPEGIYPVMYYNHNINFISVSKMMEGNFSDAIKYAKQIEQNVKPVVQEMQMLEIFYSNPLMILISFEKWGDILSYPKPTEGLDLSTAIWHFARGIALANPGKTTEATNELNEMIKLKEKIPAEAVFGFSSAKTILDLAEALLTANIAAHSDKLNESLDLFDRAVSFEDALNYDEPPDWYPSVRLNLGKVLYSAGKYEDAERVYRDDLKKYPHNGRGLFGLHESLKVQNKNEEAEKIYQELQTAWKNADTKLSMIDN
ncbi:MAG: tetratricopeptide repeat protein [Ignavibacteria bacterium]